MQDKLISFLCLFLVMPALTLAAPSLSKQNLLFIGTYSGAKSQGIYVSRFDSEKGDLSSPELAAEMKNPSFLALSPNGKFLYAVGEMENFGGKPSGSVAAFRIRVASGKLELLNEQSSEGSGPCHLALDSGGKCVLAANYGSGSICALPVNPDGSLGPARSTIQHQGSSVDASGRQTGPHAHHITPDLDDRFVLACDLGLDKVLVYRFDPAKASLVANDPPSVSIAPGAGPRHLAFHSNGKFVYVINELNPTMTVCSYDSAKGLLNTLQTISTLPEGYTNQSFCAEVQVHRSGKFLYGSNRGHDSLAIFAIDSKSGRLTSVGHQSVGKTPRHFALDPSGKWLLAENQNTHSIVVFKIDTSTGKLQETGKSIEVGSPVCAVFAPISF
jgi:6-phosphogluconolactonase